MAMGFVDHLGHYSILEAQGLYVAKLFFFTVYFDSFSVNTLVKLRYLMKD
jgi:hypothetical protein